MPSSSLLARRQRVRLIRRRVVGLATGLFLATTGGILVQLVSGHDPALATGQTTASQASTSGTAVASETTSSSSSDSTGSTSPSSSPVTPLTTSQS
jgi:hypothetical protein